MIVQLVQSNGLQIAHIVYLHMLQMAEYSGNYGIRALETDIVVNGFTTHPVSGYHFCGQQSNRQCNITEERVGDEIRFNYGYSTDYDYSTGQAHSTAVCKTYPLSEAHNVAKIAMDWLVLGIEPIDAVKLGV